MYQENQKREYLDYYDGKDRIQVYQVFKKTEEYENSLDIELCKMNSEELSDLFLNFYTITTFGPAKSRIKKYIDWCKAKNYCKVNWCSGALLPTAKIKAVFEARSKRFYISPQMYEVYCTKISQNSQNPEYELPIFKSVYELAAYRGFINLVYLTVKEVNEPYVKLQDGRRILISENLREGFMAAAKVDTMKRMNDIQLNHSFVEDCIFKTPEENLEKSHVKRFVKIFNELKNIVIQDERLSLANLNQSGLFNYVIGRAKAEGHDVKAHFEGNYQNSAMDLIYQKYFEEKGMVTSFLQFKTKYKDFIPYIGEIK